MPSPVANQTTVRVAELTVGYRVPASILDVANRLLVEVAPGVTPARSVRPEGAPPLVVKSAPNLLGQSVLAEVRALGRTDQPSDGVVVASISTTSRRESIHSIAVVGVETDLDQAEEALGGAGIEVDRVAGVGLPGQEAIALVNPERVKGLEFDAVIVMEPAAIVGQAPSVAAGGRMLYVCLTRAVQYLGVVHSQPIPFQLGLE